MLLGGAGPVPAAYMCEDQSGATGHPKQVLGGGGQMGLHGGFREGLHVQVRICHSVFARFLDPREPCTQVEPLASCKTCSGLSNQQRLSTVVERVSKFTC